MLQTSYSYGFNIGWKTVSEVLESYLLGMSCFIEAKKKAATSLWISQLMSISYFLAFFYLFTVWKSSSVFFLHLLFLLFSAWKLLGCCLIFDPTKKDLQSRHRRCCRSASRLTTEVIYLYFHNLIFGSRGWICNFPPTLCCNWDLRLNLKLLKLKFYGSR